MGVEFRQDDVLENCFVITLYSGWGWDDIAEAHAAVEAARRELGDVPLHIFARIEGPITMPAEIELKAKDWLHIHTEQNRGLLVFITAWDMVRSLIRLMSLGEGNPLSFIHFAHSTEEAREIVRHWEAPR